MMQPRKIAFIDSLAITACLFVLWTGTRSSKPGPPIPFAPDATEEAVAAAGSARYKPLAPEKSTGAERAKTKNSKRKLSSNVLIPAHPETLPYLSFEPGMQQALFEQYNFLSRKDVPARGASGITKSDMLKTVSTLQSMQMLDPAVLFSTFDFFRVNTELKNDQVRMTGYYTPLVKASRKRTGEYKYPILRRPDSNTPSPADIEAGALDNSGLALAWMSSRKEVRNAQLQGSCLLEFPDGKREHFGFGGSVKGKGGAYVFFVPVDNKVLGAGYFPLTAGYSVAVDLRYIPLGATLLAELPDLDARGKLKGYTYRIIFAQDRGGAILTTKRMDLYCGIGQPALKAARRINRFGRLWVLLPKER
jgi:3D (Asp-Asp-Asp) domain-containing protein